MSDEKNNHTATFVEGGLGFLEQIMGDDFMNDFRMKMKLIGGKKLNTYLYTTMENIKKKAKYFLFPLVPLNARGGR